jgi:hypothetical protein
VAAWASEPARLAGRGTAARQVYESCFSAPVVRRQLAAALAGLLVVVAMGAGWIVYRRLTRHAEIAPPWMPTIVAADRAAESSLLPVPSPGSPPLDGWLVRLGDHRAQEVGALTASEEGLPAFILSSRSDRGIDRDQYRHQISSLAGSAST